MNRWNSMNQHEDIFYDNLKRMRKEKGMSQQEVADKADMLVTTFSRLERGLASPSLSTMRRVSQALDVELIELLRNDEISERSLLDKFQIIEKLPEHDQGVIEIFIDTVLEKNRLQELQGLKTKKRLEELSRIRMK